MKNIKYNRNIKTRKKFRLEFCFFSCIGKNLNLNKHLQTSYRTNPSSTIHEQRGTYFESNANLNSITYRSDILRVSRYKLQIAHLPNSFLPFSSLHVSSLCPIDQPPLPSNVSIKLRLFFHAISTLLRHKIKQLTK